MAPPAARSARIGAGLRNLDPGALSSGTVAGTIAFSPASSGPPFSVGNDLLVPNLNADMLDGRAARLDAGSLVSGICRRPESQAIPSTIRLANDSASLSKVTAGNAIVSGVNIGIGHTNPQTALHVVGTVTADNFIATAAPRHPPAWRLSQPVRSRWETLLMTLTSLMQAPRT